MRKLMLMMAACLLMAMAASPAMAQQVTLGNSTAEAYDPAEYERSEINPNGPCFDPQTAPDVTGVPVEDLALAYVNRNDPAGTPIVSPLDSDNDGIACNALTQEEAASISAGGTDQEQPTTNESDAATIPPSGGDGAASPATDQYADDEMIELPDTGGPLLLPLAFGFVLMGTGVLLLKRR